MGVITNNILSLGTDEVFALRTKDGGEIRAFKQMLTLSAAEGTLVQPVGSGPWVVSAQGYEKWAKDVGAQVIFPKEVLVDGEWKENKHPTYDARTKRIVSYHVHAIAYRYTEKGILVYTDWTIIYDVRAYRLIDLLGKAKETPQAFRLLPNDLEKPQEDGTWAGYPMDEETTLWVNTAHPEALKWYSQIMNREKKSIDFAQTFARRNALKHLSAIQKAPGSSWSFPVVCWRPTSGDMVKWDPTEYVKLQDRVGDLVKGQAGTQQKPQVALLSSGIERVEDEDAITHETETGISDEDQASAIDVGGSASAAGETSGSRATQPQAGANEAENQGTPAGETAAAPASGPPPLPPSAAQPGKANQGLSTEGQKVLANLAVTRANFGEEYLAACQSLGVEPDAKHDGHVATKIILAVSRIVDAGEEGAHL